MALSKNKIVERRVAGCRLIVESIPKDAFRAAQTEGRCLAPHFRKGCPMWLRKTTNLPAAFDGLPVTVYLGFLNDRLVYVGQGFALPAP